MSISTLISALIVAILVIAGWQIVYILKLSFLSLFYQKPRGEKRYNRKYALVVPAYKAEAVAWETVQNLLQLTGDFKIFLIADSFSEGWIAKFESLPIELVQVQFEKSTKAKAINYALPVIQKYAPDAIVILDVDNTVDKNFIQEIGVLPLLESLPRKRTLVWQLHRTAKNKENALAALDGISEEINNSIFRKGAHVAKINSAIIGSGMLLPAEVVYELFPDNQAIGGFDKELEVQFLNENINVKYANHIKVYDEKVAEQQVLDNQRKRWLSAQLTYAKKYFWKMVGYFFTARFFKYFKLVQLYLLPRIVLIGLSIMLFTLGLIHIFIVGKSAINQLAVLLPISYAVALFIAIPGEVWRWKTIATLLTKTPGLIIQFTRLLFRLKGANETFIHTPHKAQSDENSH